MCNFPLYFEFLTNATSHLTPVLGNKLALMTHLKELFLRDPATNEIVSGVSFTYSIFPPTNRKQRRVLIANIMPKRKKGGRARGKQSSNNVSRNRSSTTGSYGKKTTGLPLRSLTPSEVEVMVGSWREQVKSLTKSSGAPFVACVALI